MPIDKRTLNVGHLTQQRKIVKEAKLRAHSIVMNILYAFEPIDSAREYIRNIKMDELKLYFDDLNIQIEILRKAENEIENLKNELGIDEEG